MRAKLLLTLIILPFCGFSQSRVQSIVDALQTATEDTVRIDSYMKLYDLTVHSKDSSLNYVKEAVLLAEKKGLNKWIALSRIREAGWYFTHSGNRDSTILLCRQLLERMEKAGYVKGMALACHKLGEIYVWNALDSSMYYYLKSIELHNSIKDFTAANRTKVSLANTYAEMNKLDDAIQTALEAINYYKSKDIDSIATAIAMINIGEYYLRKGDLLNAEKYTLESWKFNLKNPYSEAYGMNQLALIYMAGNKSEEAERLYHRIVETGKSHQMSEVLTMGYNGLAKIAKAEKHWDDVINYKSLAWEHSYKNREEKSSMLEMFVEAYRQKEDYKNAFHFYQLYVAERDSYDSHQRLKAADEIEARFKNREKAERIKYLTIEHQNRIYERNLVFIIGGLVVLLLIAILYVIRQRQRLKLTEEKHTAVMQERKRISAEIHDELGSEFSKIGLLSELLKRDFSDTGNREHLQSISDSAREALSKMSEIVWSLNPRNDYLDSFISYLRKYAIELFEQCKIECVIKTSADFPHSPIDGIKRRQVFLVYKEALNNIIKHSCASNVEVEFGFQNQALSIRIRDNGKGFDIAIVTEGRTEGNGLKNMKERMEQVGGTLQIKSENGIMINLIIPLKSEIQETISP